MKLLIRYRLFLIILIVVVIQFSLLKVILNNGFTGDDWLLLFDYKTTISPSVIFLDKIFGVFHTKGIYTAYQALYIGILESFFKGNYQAYQITNIIFKILATLSLYPLILVIFKRRLLAFLTTVLYAISYSSAGALQFVVKGSDYLAIFFMNIFLLSYYYSFKIKKRSLLLISSILLFLSFILSPIRMYPLLLFIIFVEVFIWIKRKGLLGLVISLLRLLLILAPFLMMLLLLYKSTGNYLNGPFVIYNFLSYGNYQLLLSPFAGLGYTFLPNDYWFIFGRLNLDNFKDYLVFLLRGPIIIYSIITILIGFLITARKKTRFTFIFGVILVNIAFEIICYFLITNLRGIAGPNVKGFYPVSTYAIFLGFFCLSLGFASLFTWFKNRSNILLLSLFLGPVFSSVFLWGTWLIIGDSLTFKEGIHWYLIIPPIGSSLFLASLMVLGFDRIKRILNPNLKKVLLGFLFLTIFAQYLISNREIHTTFSYLTSIGYGASDQEEIKSKLLSHIKDPLDKKPTLFYLDASKDLQNQLFFPVTLISGFEKRMHFRNWEIINGCISLIYDKTILKKSIIIKDGIKGFNANSLCVENSFGVSESEIFYKPDDFYAFRLKNKEVIDIKKSVLEELGL